MKKFSIKEQREARKAELKEKYRESSANKKYVETVDALEDVNTSVTSSVISVVSMDNNSRDIESKDSYIIMYKIICELKQTKEEKKSGKEARKLTIGTYIDEQMRDRAYEVLKNAIASKHEVKEAVGENGNKCFIATGVDQYFESFRLKVYKYDDSITVNVLDRNRISRLFDIEV